MEVQSHSRAMVVKCGRRRKVDEVAVKQGGQGILMDSEW